MLFKNLVLPSITTPVKRKPKEIKDEQGNVSIEPVDEVYLDLYQEAIKKFGEREERLNATLRALYNVVWGQCLELMKNKLQEYPKFDAMDVSGDVALLLTRIRDASNQKQERIQAYDGLDEIQRQFCNNRQQPDETNRGT